MLIRDLLKIEPYPTRAHIEAIIEVSMSYKQIAEVKHVFASANETPRGKCAIFRMLGGFCFGGFRRGGWVVAVGVIR